MKSFRDRNPYVIGIVSVLVIGLLTGLAFAVGLLHLLEKAYEMGGVFVDAAGLRRGDEVKLAGVKVGRVTDIEPDPATGQVRVVWVVNDGVEIRTDATAEIALETLLGTRYVRIGNATDGDDLFEDLPRDERVVEETRVPFDVFELTRISTEAIETADNDQLNALINDLADITEGRRAQVTDLIEGLDRVSTAITQRDEQLTQLLERTDQVTATLAEKDQTLVALIDASRQILDLIANRRDELSRALGEGSQAVAELTRIITEHEAELDRILDVLHPTLDVVAARQGDIDNGLSWLGPAFYQQGLAGAHGPWVDIYIRDIGTGYPAALCDLFAPGDPECPR